MTDRPAMPARWQAVELDGKQVTRWQKGGLYVTLLSCGWCWYSMYGEWHDGGGYKVAGHLDSGVGFSDPVACAVVCEMTFGSTKTYEPVTRSVR
jgi:hypothetical protein